MTQPLNQNKMKGLISLMILFMCLVTIMPMVFLFCEHMINGRDSNLQQLLDNL